MEKLAQNRTKKTHAKIISELQNFLQMLEVLHNEAATFTCTTFQHNILSPGLTVGSPSFSNPTTP